MMCLERVSLTTACVCARVRQCVIPLFNSSANKALIKEKLELRVLIGATEKPLDSLVVRFTAGGQNRMNTVS